MEGRRFTPLKTFDELVYKTVNRYYKGKIYTLREGNIVLANKCVEWEKNGKIVWLDDAPVGVLPPLAMPAGQSVVKGQVHVK